MSGESLMAGHVVGYGMTAQPLDEAHAVFETTVQAFLEARDAYKASLSKESASHRALVLSDKAGNLSAAAFALQRAAYADAQKK